MRVNVNANGQKQVALLQKPAVPFDLLYGATIWPEAVTEAAPLHMLVRMENKEKQGLGLPLPSGGIALFETVSGADVLVGQDNLRDHAIGEEVEAQLGDSAQLHYRQDRLSEDSAQKMRYRLEIPNATNRPPPPP